MYAQMSQGKDVQDVKVIQDMIWLSEPPCSLQL